MQERSVSDEGCAKTGKGACARNGGGGRYGLHGSRHGMRGLSCLQDAMLCGKTVMIAPMDVSGRAEPYIREVVRLVVAAGR